MMAWQDELAPALEAISIPSPSMLRFAGYDIPVAAQPSLTGIETSGTRPLIASLQALLYWAAYARQFTGPPSLAPAVTVVPSDDAVFVGQLTAANRTAPRYDVGWVVMGVEGNGVVRIQKGERQRRAAPGEFLWAGAPSTPPTVGGVVHLFVPRESTVAQTGFYFVYSETVSDEWDDATLVRFYFHTSADGAPGLVEFVSTALNRYRIPFRMKTLSHPAAYDRADAAVLYSARRFYPLIARLLLAMPPSCRGQLRERTPLFTAALVAGVGVADEPNTGDSFGMHRCGLVALGVCDAAIAGRHSATDRIAAVTARFSAAGLDPAKPHLRRGSAELPDVAESIGFAYE